MCCVVDCDCLCLCRVWMCAVVAVLVNATCHAGRVQHRVHNSREIQTNMATAGFVSRSLRSESNCTLRSSARWSNEERRCGCDQASRTVLSTDVMCSMYRHVNRYRYICLEQQSVHTLHQTVQQDNHECRRCKIETCQSQPPTPNAIRPNAPMQNQHMYNWDTNQLSKQCKLN